MRERPASLTDMQSVIDPDKPQRKVIDNDVKYTRTKSKSLKQKGLMVSSPARSRSRAVKAQGCNALTTIR